MQKKKIKEKSFEYPPYEKSTEPGFYIVCSDKMILENVDSLMRGRGYMGVTDIRGRIHYLVDGRKSLHAAVHQIIKEVDEEPILSKPLHAILDIGIESVFLRYGIDSHLLGGELLSTMLLLCARSPELLKGVSKNLYEVVGKRYHLSSVQVEKNVRYALRKSSLPEDSRKNVAALQFLLKELLLRAEAQKGRATE